MPTSRWARRCSSGCGRLAWAPIASTERLTHYALQARRGSAAADATGILPDYRSVSAHHGWAVQRADAACRHASCNIHHLRELTFLDEQYQQSSTKDLKRLLLEMKAVTDQVRTRDLARLPAPAQDALVTQYEALLAAGLPANPPPDRGPRWRRRIKQSLARNLLERLWLGRDRVLAFLGDLTIPFGNNQAERDLRLHEAQQQVSGCFRLQGAFEGNQHTIPIQRLTSMVRASRRQHTSPV